MVAIHRTSILLVALHNGCLHLAKTEAQPKVLKLSVCVFHSIFCHGCFCWDAAPNAIRGSLKQGNVLFKLDMERNCDFPLANLVSTTLFGLFGQVVPFSEASTRMRILFASARL